MREPMPMKQADGGQGSIAVYVCTHRRNGPLAQMLGSLSVAAAQVQPSIEIAVVVVDDNPDGRAKEVVDTFDTSCFLRGLHYRYSGAQNISLARNTGLEAAMELAEWVAMTDDDQTVTEGWFAALAGMQRRTNADAVTGPVKLRYLDGAPDWLTSQPFGDIVEAAPQPDAAKMPVCSTGNSMLRSSFLRDHPDIRFRSDLGTVGGEDMVFYKAAVAAGLDARFSNEALCYGEQPPERSTYRSVVRSCYWLGNTEFVTNFDSGDATRARMALRAVRRLVEAIVRPASRLATGKSAQWRYTGACLARTYGILVGVLGVRVAHK
jgi:succinoglycan biosynthesis protein ExoM